MSDRSLALASALQQKQDIVLPVFCERRNCGTKSHDAIPMAAAVQNGGFGTVYATADGANVVKINADRVDADIIRREITMHIAKHANIIRVHSCYAINGIVRGIVMENGGRDFMDHLMATGALDDGCLHDFSIDILRAVSYLHDHEIYHLDIKPENMLSGTDGNGYRILKLCDFGLSHGDGDEWKMHPHCNFGIFGMSHGDGDEWETHSGRKFGSLAVDGPKYFGSPSYMPHFELATRPDFLRKRDLWAVGCVMFIMAYGIMLYDAPNTPHYNRVWEKLATKKPDYFASLGGVAPRFIEKWMRQLVSTDPTSCTAILDESQVQSLIGRA